MDNILHEPALKYAYTSAVEYLEAERTAEQKHELIRGRIITMTGASLQHNRIVRNLIGNLHGLLKGKTCEVFPSDLRVHIASVNSFTYPDVTIVCGKPELLDEHFDTLLNPVVIIEVLSPSTSYYDKGDKFFTYQQLNSLKEYILIDSANTDIRQITKKQDGLWKFETIDNISSSLFIESIQQSVLLSDIYDGVTF